jgi:hypothetical protein
MRACGILVIAVFGYILTGCIISPTTIPTAIPTGFQKQPEPQEPLIYGSITGVPDGTLVSVKLLTPSEREAVSINREGNGYWEAVITDASGVDYVVTAIAQGYMSSPTSYTVHLDEDAAKVYLVVNGKVTANEAVNLDFHFRPK